MDLTTIAGFIAGIVFMVISIRLGGELITFWDPPSAMITIGGTISALLISYPFGNLLSGLKTIRHTFNKLDSKEIEVIKRIIELANIARKEGLLALEEKANDVEDEFIKKGILLIVDGTEPELVRSVLDTELAFIEGRHKDNQGVWENMAALGPAWGMIGTLIGLINMLKNLSDPSSIGPSMSVALLTTMYGSLIANFLANPVLTKLKDKSSVEVLLKELTIEGLLSIQAGENPRIIEEKLKAFLSPADRIAYSKDDSAEAEEGA